MRYEYFTFPLSGVDAWEKRERFDTLGKNGWRLVCTDATSYIFMRKIEEVVKKEEKAAVGDSPVRGNFFKGYKR